MTRRDAILEGAQAAARLHVRLGSRARLEASPSCVDVFGAILSIGAALLFRPLDGLLGFCIRIPSLPGIVVSTQRPLRIQRFTAAHELGHVMLGHTASLDGPEILARGDLKDDLEVAADSFASAFLLPRWLLQQLARRHGWNRESMENPHVVYQLSLRASASYEATCWALEQHGIISSAVRKRLLQNERRDLKAELLDGLNVESFHRDVWVLNETDEGVSVEGQPDDLFIINLSERGSTGYLWDLGGLAAAGFVILRDQRAIPAPEQGIGAAVQRSLTAKHGLPVSGKLSLRLSRPWQRDEFIRALTVSYDLRGKEIGMPRAVRKQLMAA